MNFSYDNTNGYTQIVHKPELGQKEQGMYKNTTWTNVVLNGVPLDTILDLELQDKFIHYKNTHHVDEDTVMVNDRQVPYNISVSESSIHLDNPVYERHFRKRKIPLKKHKNFTSKPSSKQITKENKEVSFSEDIKHYWNIQARM